MHQAQGGQGKPTRGTQELLQGSQLYCSCSVPLGCDDRCASRAPSVLNTGAWQSCKGTGRLVRK
eukprot:1159344-Pelagomonas_calceolata.AAC.16